jgi:hypothetical protein
MAPPSAPSPSATSDAGSDEAEPAAVTDEADGWTARTWTGVVLLAGVGVALVTTVARHLRARHRRRT